MKLSYLDFSSLPNASTIISRQIFIKILESMIPNRSNVLLVNLLSVLGMVVKGTEKSLWFILSKKNGNHN